MMSLSAARVRLTSMRWEHHTKMDAIEKHDLQQLPSPFGLKNQVPGNVQMQIVIPKDLGGHHAILKH